jgi:hypothetical protein
MVTAVVGQFDHSLRHRTPIDGYASNAATGAVRIFDYNLIGS